MVPLDQALDKLLVCLFIDTYVVMELLLLQYLFLLLDDLFQLLDLLLELFCSLSEFFVIVVIVTIVRIRSGYL